jgi:general secretion pathway protein C
VEGDGVVIEQGGERVRLALDKLPETPILPSLIRP